MKAIRMRFSCVLTLLLVLAVNEQSYAADPGPRPASRQDKTLSAANVSKLPVAVSTTGYRSASAESGAHARAVSVNGRWAVVGDRALNTAWLYDLKEEDSSAQPLRLSGHSSSVYFGHSVFTNGHYLAVGDPYWSARGIVRLFALDAEKPDHGPDHYTDLTTSDSTAGNMFGYDLSMSGDMVVVGSPDTNHPGKVYFYRIHQQALHLTGSSEGSLTASDGEPGNMYGTASAYGDVLLVGAMSQGRSGAAYLYQLNAGNAGDIQQSEIKILPPAASGGDQFGADVAVGEHYMLIGQPFHDADPAHEAIGSAWLYRIHPDQPQASVSDYLQLMPADGFAGMHFGMTVDIMDHYAIVGTYCEDDGVGAYLFDLTADDINASQVKLSIASDYGDEGKPLGVSVSGNGEISAVRARFNGRFYLFKHHL
ncbi:MAG: hypothetical protein CMI02_16705 [Oceanospirillaceae bacterium]|nr:hypothetical protein [Oceanospirillaceae bacterium]MBT13662.1 hypothetical protein [Oceanospirillaceae bacterium]|tara:strand:+ start:67878 stop:69146 length:1269 start_codon:yes stop_codon:yes gene_type:complete